MKHLLILMIAIAGITTASFAQTKPMVSARIKTPGVMCEACKARLEEYLKRYDGIGAVTVNYRKGEVAVKYATDRINIETIKAAISNAGYDADDIPANPDAYKLLPRTCKKFEDGGGHPKPKTPVVTQ